MNHIKLKYNTRRILTRVTSYSLSILLLILIIKGWVVSLTAYEDAKQEYVEAMACVAKHISRGVERKDIQVLKGTCIVTPNGYYKQ